MAIAENFKHKAFKPKLILIAMARAFGWPEPPIVVVTLKDGKEKFSVNVPVGRIF